jgi:hypothetical protein
MTKSQLNNHFLVYGLNEKRVGSFSVFLEKEKIDMNLLKRFNPSQDKLQLMDTMKQGTLARWIIENNENLKNNPKYQVEFTITDTITEDHPEYAILTNHEYFRKISSWEELQEYISRYPPKKYFNSPFYDTPWVHNIETFYQNYPTFDLIYYKNRYLKEMPYISDLDVLIYYHTVGRTVGHAINKTYTLVFYSPLYLPNSGGIRVLHNMVATINNLGEPMFNAKLYNIHNKTYTNPICNEYIYSHDLHDNCISVYPEIITGNPLKCNYVVRWILLALGMETPHSIKDSWGPKDLIYHWESKNDSNILRKHIINEEFQKRNFQPRTQTCYLIKKGRLIEDNYLSRHPHNSMHLDPFTENVSTFKNEVMVNIFNKCKLLYCYDIKTMWIVYAIFCGCAVVILPPPTTFITEDVFFEQSVFNYKDKIHRHGISWGGHPRNIANAIETVDQQAMFLRYMYKQEDQYIRGLINKLTKRLKL